MFLRALAFWTVMLLLTSIAFADNDSSERWRILGYYGLGVVNPADINNVSNSQNTTPKLNSITSSTVYGGGIGHRLFKGVDFQISYSSQDGKSSVNTTSPFAKSGAGFELTQNEIWGGLNVYLHHSAKTYVYLGGAAGYPVSSTVQATLASNTSYTAAQTVAFMGTLGAGVFLEKHFSLFAEAGYQSDVSGDIKTSSGTILTTSSGAHAKMDLSGVRAVGGLAIHF